MTNNEGKNTKRKKKIGTEQFETGVITYCVQQNNGHKICTKSGAGKKCSTVYYGKGHTLSSCDPCRAGTGLVNPVSLSQPTS